LKRLRITAVPTRPASDRELLPTAWECGIRNSTISEDDAEIAQVEDEKVIVKGDARNPER
jgi:hypothetical protein